ncbi:SPFH domain-containing protein [Streptomyces sp. KLOTTS4A1]|uniref:SPFH domain-containing protein n=1 Tax=Streptomyces sp. KLOTTS4A1 TaxID=3390996 RepID=UPI0039F5F5D1
MASAGTGSGAPGAERVRLIQNEATTEIPVHLLFRDEAGTGVRPPVRKPGAVPRTGPGPKAGPALRAGSALRAGTALRTGADPRAGVAPEAGPGPAGSARPVLPLDEALAERPAAACSGGVAVGAGAAGVAGCGAGLWWSGLVPDLALRLAHLPVIEGAQPGPAQWALLTGSGALALCSFAGLGRGRTGRAWVLSLFGRYRGSVRRTGLVWINPFLKRRRIDVRLRHWRSEPLSAVDAQGAALRVVVLVAWRVQDTARAAIGVDSHETYLRECVEAAIARVFSQLPADALLDEGPSLRDAETVGDALTRVLAAQAAPAGIEVFSAQPTRIEYAPEVAEAMQRRRAAALDALHRESALARMADSVEDTLTRLSLRGLVDFDEGERKALVKDLTVAFCTGHGDRSAGPDKGVGTAR